MTACRKCLRLDCAVLARLADYRRDPFALLPLQNAMIACGVIASYRKLGAGTPQPVDVEMIRDARRMG